MCCSLLKSKCQTFGTVRETSPHHALFVTCHAGLSAESPCSVIYRFHRASMFHGMKSRCLCLGSFVFVQYRRGLLVVIVPGSQWKKPDILSVSHIVHVCLHFVPPPSNLTFTVYPTRRPSWRRDPSSVALSQVSSISLSRGLF